MLNYIWLGLILLSVLLGGWNGRLQAVTDGAFDATKTAVLTIALPLIGIMSLWLGIMRLAEKSGMIVLLARALRPVMRRLFPDVPENHPAMGSMLMNMAANMLGLANAATPLGLRAMSDLEKLNPRPGTATNAMCTFLAINTSSLQLIPTTPLAILVAAGSVNPTAIIGTSLLATCCSTLVGVTSVKLLEKLPFYRLPPVSLGTQASATASPAEALLPAESLSLQNGLAVAPLAWWGKVLLGLYFAFFLVVLGRTLQSGSHGFLEVVNAVSLLTVPFLLSFFPLYAALRRLRVYEEFVEGAKEGFHVAVRIIPFLVTMLVAIGMFRGAGGIDRVTEFLAPVMNWLHFPTELVPMVLMRPLSGSGTTGIFSDLVKTYGPDSLITRTAATIFGSTETTFYVIAVYFGAVAVKRTRHAVPAGLLADLAGVIAAVIICRRLF